MVIYHQRAALALSRGMGNRTQYCNLNLGDDNSIAVARQLYGNDLHVPVPSGSQQRPFSHGYSSSVTGGAAIWRGMVASLRA